MNMKKRSEFLCDICGFRSAKWLGNCPECKEWNTFQEHDVSKGEKRSISSVSEAKAKPMNEVKQERIFRIKTEIAEFDRVMGEGLALGSLNLIGGEPGIGKSTLLLEVCGQLAKLYPQEKILYVSGEESDYQIAQRAKRLDINEDNLYLLNETSWQTIKEQIKKVNPFFLVLDSIQTTVSEEIQSPSGTLSQIREVTYELMNYTKANEMTAMIIGHVTKDGQIAGPKILEHMVDAVVYFEGDQFNQYRLLRAIKNRFGNTNEVGLFEMKNEGLSEVKNPSEYFLEGGLDNAFGRSITCVLEGSRSLFVETQALVVENKYGNGRRTTQGLDSNKLAMLVAILEKYYELPLGFSDIYVNVVGGIKLGTRESDLSILASLLSSFYKTPVSSKYIFLGEVGLTGEVRNVSFFEKRLKEIEKLNYEKVFTSKRIASEYQKKTSINLIGLKHISEMREYLFL